MRSAKTVFVSYANEDKIIADRVVLSLRGRGLKVFLDKDDPPAGGSYDERIHQAIRSSAAFVFLISPASVGDGRYTLTELKFAREKWPHPGKSVLPVMIAPTDLRQVPEYLKAVTILEPHGNLAAEVSAAVAAQLQGSLSPALVFALGGAATVVAVGAFYYYGVPVSAVVTPAAVEILTEEPPMGKLAPGQRVLVDDGSCPSGQIKEVIGGDFFNPDGSKKATGIERKKRCIPRV
jgi:hypothetical protein